MSIQFNATSTPYKGLVQLFEREIGASLGDVSGTAQKLAEFTSDCNIALDDFIELAIKSSGKWQFDDSGHSDYPIITTNLVANQRDYSFTTDGSSNLVLDIYRVAVANSSGVYTEIDPVDQQSGADLSSFFDGQNTTGTPYRYDKTANGIFLDPIPSYNYTNGLKVFINREGSYFTVSDTTKKPGVPGLFHKYFYLKPAREFARRNSLASYNRLDADVTKLEENIQSYFADREKDVDLQMINEPVIFE